METTQEIYGYYPELGETSNTAEIVYEHSFKNKYLLHTDLELKLKIVATKNESYSGKTCYEVTESKLNKMMQKYRMVQKMLL